MKKDCKNKDKLFHMAKLSKHSPECVSKIVWGNSRGWFFLFLDITLLLWEQSRL